MLDAPIPELILYGRPGCGLCDEARALVTAILDARTNAGLKIPALVERDIGTDPAWERAFFTTIPVVELGGRHLELAISAARIGRFLSDFLDT